MDIDMFEREREKSDGVLNTFRKHCTAVLHLYTSRKHLYTTRKHLYTTRKHFYTTRKHLYTTRKHFYTTRKHLYTTREHLYTTRKQYTGWSYSLESVIAVSLAVSLCSCAAV